jgi:hypothetical protein
MGSHMPKPAISPSKGLIILLLATALWTIAENKHIFKESIQLLILFEIQTKLTFLVTDLLLSNREIIPLF